MNNALIFKLSLFGLVAFATAGETSATPVYPGRPASGDAKRH